MKDRYEFSFTMADLPKDENGLTGRDCPECEKYFKIKFGTGLKDTDHCYCPYCKHKGDPHDFMTKEQNDYLESIVTKKVLGEVMKGFDASMKQLERATRNSLIKIKVRTSGNNFNIKHYTEKELETNVICDSCTLEFAIYGVFASCPDCLRLNANVILQKSLDAEKRKMNLIDQTEDNELKEGLMEDVLSGCVSAFDGFGKELRSHYPNKFPANPKNLFQNLMALSSILSASVGKSLSDMIGINEFDQLIKLFQIRHIYQHNMGVVDDGFINKVPGMVYLKGKKYPLKKGEVDPIFDLLKQAATKIEEEVKE